MSSMYYEQLFLQNLPLNQFYCTKGELPIFCMSHDARRYFQDFAAFRKLTFPAINFGGAKLAAWPLAN